MSTNFQKSLAQGVNRLKVGDGLEEDTDIGSVINKASYEKITSQIDGAVQKGAEILTSSKHIVDKQNSCYFVSPTVLKNVDVNMTIMHEETFGPVALVTRFTELR